MVDEVVEVKPDAKPDAELPVPGALPPAMKRKYDEAITESKKRQEKIRELEAKAAELEQYRDTFKDHEQAKAMEAQKQAEARAREEAENRNRQEVQVKRQLAAARALIGVVPQGDRELGDFAMWKLETDPGISYDPETGLFTGLDEAVAALAASPRFAGAGAPGKKPAPGLPAPSPAVSVDSKFANVKTFNDLVTLGAAAVREYFDKYPDKYALLKAGQKQGLESPTRVIPPAAMRSN